MKIRVENTYSDGHESTIEYKLPSGDVDYALLDGIDGLDDLLYRYTGDGHGLNSDLGCFYTITILESDRPELVGYTREWD